MAGAGHTRPILVHMYAAHAGALQSERGDLVRRSR